MYRYWEYGNGPPLTAGRMTGIRRFADPRVNLVQGMAVSCAFARL